jgi:hypothetical protein
MEEVCRVEDRPAHSEQGIHRGLVVTGNFPNFSRDRSDLLLLSGVSAHRTGSTKGPKMNPTRITRSTIALATAGLVFGAVMFGTGVSAASAAPQGPGRSGDAHAEHGHPNPDAVRGHDEEGKHGKGHESHGNGHGYGHGDHDGHDEVVIIETPAVETPAGETPTTETPGRETPAQETPAQETPAQQNPAQETPAVEAPTVGTPIVDQPAAKVSIVDANPVAQVLSVEVDAVDSGTAPFSVAANSSSDARSGGSAAGVKLHHR